MCKDYHLGAYRQSCMLVQKQVKIVRRDHEHQLLQLEISAIHTCHRNKITFRSRKLIILETQSNVSHEKNVYLPNSWRKCKLYWWRNVKVQLSMFCSIDSKHGTQWALTFDMCKSWVIISHKTERKWYTKSSSNMPYHETPVVMDRIPNFLYKWPNHIMLHTWQLL